MNTTNSSKFTIFSVRLMMVMMILLIISGLFNFIFKPSYEISTIEIGDVYCYTYGEENPFKKPYVKYHRVIDIKNDYVLYVDTITGDTSSTKTRLFLIDSEKVK